VADLPFLDPEFALATFTLVGTVLGAVIAALVSLLNTRRRANAEQRLARATLAEGRSLALTDRASAFLAAATHFSLSLRDMALADSLQKSIIEKSEVWPSVDRANSTLFAIGINDSDALGKAAKDLDEALVKLSRDAKNAVYTPEEWEKHRREVLGSLPEDVIRVARQEAQGFRDGAPV
jgi:hypothetical protein